jgi:hypothetical protein
MERTEYDKQAWRDLPRDGECIVAFLFGDSAGECHGRIDRHHVDPPHPRSVQCCARHHPKLEAARRHLTEEPRQRWKPCPHPAGTHRYPGAREACERRLNRQALEDAA